MKLLNMKRTKGTEAYIRFCYSILRTKSLIQIGDYGIKENDQLLSGVLSKLDDVKTLKGKVPSNYRYSVTAKDLGNGFTELGLDKVSAYKLKKIVASNLFFCNKNKDHLNSIILVYVWASFETYLCMLFEEMFISVPEMLKSDQTVTYRDIIDNKDNVVELLIKKEVDSLGHFTLDDYLKYLKKKISFETNIQTRKKLVQLYTLRNIVAHHTGLVKQTIKKESLPPSIKIRDSEIIVTKQYLESSLKLINLVVQEIEKYSIKRVLKSKTK